MKRPLTRVVLAVCIPVGLLLSACGFGGFTHSNTTDVPAPADAAGLVLIVLQGFTVAAVTRPKDIPQPDELGTAITALVRGLLET